MPDSLSSEVAVTVIEFSVFVVSKFTLIGAVLSISTTLIVASSVKLTPSLNLYVILPFACVVKIVFVFTLYHVSFVIVVVFVPSHVFISLHGITSIFDVKSCVELIKINEFSLNSKFIFFSCAYPVGVIVVFIVPNSFVVIFALFVSSFVLFFTFTVISYSVLSSKLLNVYVFESELTNSSFPILYKYSDTFPFTVVVTVILLLVQNWK